jgi:hypothetical protein
MKELLKNPAVRKLLVLVAVAALTAVTAATGVGTDIAKDICTELEK